MNEKQRVDLMNQSVLQTALQQRNEAQNKMADISAHLNVSLAELREAQALLAAIPADVVKAAEDKLNPPSKVVDIRSPDAVPTS